MERQLGGMMSAILLRTFKDNGDGTSTVTMRSPRTGADNTLVLRVDRATYDRWLRGDGLIQNLMPELSADEREFLMTGYTREDWDKIFPPEGEEP